MEMSFHPLFNMATGQCRLDYRRMENRWVGDAVGLTIKTDFDDKFRIILLSSS